jgi:hypothetical protein
MDRNITWEKIEGKDGGDVGREQHEKWKFCTLIYP